VENRASRLIHAINKLPESFSNAILSIGFGFVAKIFGTTGIRVRSIKQDQVELYLPNRKKVRNHFGTVAAGVAILHAETASGIVMGMNVPDNCLPVLKSVQFNFPKRMHGGLTATSWLTDKQLEQIKNSDKGEMIVQTRIIDDSGREPVNGSFTWAWIPKSR